MEPLGNGWEFSDEGLGFRGGSGLRVQGVYAQRLEVQGLVVDDRVQVTIVLSKVPIVSVVVPLCGVTLELQDLINPNYVVYLLKPRKDTTMETIGRSVSGFRFRGPLGTVLPVLLLPLLSISSTLKEQAQPKRTGILGQILEHSSLSHIGMCVSCRS